MSINYRFHIEGTSHVFTSAKSLYEHIKDILVEEHTESVLAQLRGPEQYWRKIKQRGNFIEDGADKFISKDECLKCIMLSDRQMGKKKGPWLMESEGVEKIKAFLEKHPNLSYVGIYGKWRSKSTKFVVRCAKHGNSQTDFEDQWYPTYRGLTIDGHNCLYCHGLGKYSLVTISQKLIAKYKDHPRYDFNRLTGPERLGFPTIKPTNELRSYKDIRVEMFCKRHELTFNHSVNNLLHHDKGCNRCGNNYQRTEKELRQFLIEILPSNILFEGFIGKYVNNTSKCKVRCTTCGLGSDFLREWTPTVASLVAWYKGLRTRGCPKCAGNYGRHDSEFIDEANKATPETLTIRGIYKIYDETGINRYADAWCEFHGRLRDNEQQLSLKHAIHSGSGCQRCAHINLLLKDASRMLLTDEYERALQKRALYYFQYIKSDSSSFFKIGLAKAYKSTKRVIEVRYSKDFVGKTKMQCHLILPNFIAILTEAHILNTYQTTFQEYLRNNGGTECFSQNILPVEGLIHFVESAFNNFDSMMKHIGVDAKAVNALKAVLETHIELNIDEPKSWITPANVTAF